MLFDLAFDESILIRVGSDFTTGLHAGCSCLLLMVQMSKVVGNSVVFLTFGVIIFGAI